MTKNPRLVQLFPVDGSDLMWFKCTFCGDAFVRNEEDSYNFCPYCGTKAKEVFLPEKRRPKVEEDKNSVVPFSIQYERYALYDKSWHLEHVDHLTPEHWLFFKAGRIRNIRIKPSKPLDLP